MNNRGQMVISGTSRLDKPTTLEDVMTFLEDWLKINVAEGDASPKTLSAYTYHIGQFVAWCAEVGIEPLYASEHNLAEYRRHLSAVAGLARGTIGVKLSAVRRFYDAATWRGVRQDNPAAGLKPPKDHTSRRDRILAQYLNPQEVARILDVPKPSTPEGARNLAIIETMYRQGLRVSEVVSLRLTHYKREGVASLSIEGGKGGRDRVAVLVPASIAALNHWIDGARDELQNQRSNGAMFLSMSRATYGAPLSIQGVRWIINQTMKAAGVYREGVSCHALRHAYASHALAQGADLAAVSAALGHSSLQTTTVYAHVVDAVEQNPAKFLPGSDSDRTGVPRNGMDD